MCKKGEELTLIKSEIKSSRSRPLRATIAMTLIAAFSLTLGGIVVAAPAEPAYAATMSLTGATVFNYKTYYSTPRVKATTGTAYMGLTAGSDNCGSGGVFTGFRSTVAVGGEATQFPWDVVGGGSVQYSNVGAPPAARYTFSAGTYYFNARLLCGEGGSGTWSGNVTW